jgi:hypothetical protein
MTPTARFATSVITSMTASPTSQTTTSTTSQATTSTTTATTASTTASTTAPERGSTPQRPDSALGRLARPLRPRTLPGRIRAAALAAVLAVAALFAVTGSAIGDARDGLRVIGHGAGPQVVATGDLYFSLSDMDAQLANVLLIGREQDLGVGRARALAVYEQRRAQADRATLQASELASRDPSGQRTVQAVLDGLGRYERLASQALLLDEQAGHAAGPPPRQVIDLHRRATDLMKLDLLPKAYNLTLDNGTIVRRTYEAKRSSVLDGRLWVVATGLVLLALLVGLQLFLSRRFRRLINPALVLATLVTLVLVAVSVGLLSAEAGQLRKAKQDGFDSILALSRARAISNSLNADESRYLLDPGRADTYEQVYLDKSQSILYVPANNLDAYHAGVDTDLAAYRARRDVRFLGFYGEEARHLTVGRQGDAVGAVLTAYQRFQQDDLRLRGLVGAGRQREAIGVRMGRTQGSSIHDFDDYDRALVSLIGIHQNTFDTAIRAGDGALNGWNWLLPGAALVIAALILAGVRPRLSEFR